jgi:hypothetical protein
MKAIAKRLRRLEEQGCIGEPGKRHQQMRLVVSGIGQPLDLANSTCSRKLDSSGHLLELIALHGSRHDLTDEQMENFVQSFPIEAEPVDRNRYRY